MPIYDKPVRSIIPEMVDALVPTRTGTFSREDAIAWFGARFPRIKQGTITAHLIRFSTNAPSRLHYSAKPGEDLLLQIDGGHFRRYDAGTDPLPIHSKSDVPAVSVSSLVVAEQPEPSEFAYESDLRDFLAKNLSVIEPGLTLYQEEGITGVEFPVGGRFVDILALDAAKQFVVIELKVSKGYDRVVGQLLRYMAWIARHQAEPGQSVRGIIAAREISEDLKLACSALANVALYEYELSVKLRRINVSGSDA